MMAAPWRAVEVGPASPLTETALELATQMVAPLGLARLPRQDVETRIARSLVLVLVLVLEAAERYAYVEGAYERTMRRRERHERGCRRCVTGDRCDTFEDLGRQIRALAFQRDCERSAFESITRNLEERR